MCHDTPQRRADDAPAPQAPFSPEQWQAGLYTPPLLPDADAEQVAR
jgi:hypothetical protein